MPLVPGRDAPGGRPRRPAGRLLEGRLQRRHDDRHAQRDVPHRPRRARRLIMRGRRPKKLLAWRYDDGAGMTMDIPVYQVTNHGEISLRVDIPALDLREEQSDINVLREKVSAALKARLVLE